MPLNDEEFDEYTIAFEEAVSSTLRFCCWGYRCLPPHVVNVRYFVVGHLRLIKQVAMFSKGYLQQFYKEMLKAKAFQYVTALEMVILDSY
jgi:hypothetical protein